MKNIFGVALGILAAIGGFVDIGDIVFNVAAGARLSATSCSGPVVIGVGGIIHLRRDVRARRGGLEGRLSMGAVPRDRRDAPDISA